MTLTNEITLLRAKRDKLKKIQEIKHGLPHLYCFPFYKWQRDSWNDTSTFQFDFAANQVGKSSINIRKCIDYATNPSRWKIFLRQPRLIFYLYPDKKTATREFETKWVPEFLPRYTYRDDPQYGWKEEWDGKDISSIAFNTGITIYFKTYGVGSDHAHTMQASTPAIVACDEELPTDLFPELSMRIASPANKGAMFWMVCTPTRAQIYWSKVQSGKIKLPSSSVRTISMYDCLVYEDGSKSLWTKERIQQIEQSLPSQREIDIRVHGLFKPSVDSIQYPTFDRDRHIIEPHDVSTWELYCGIDYGIGGLNAHPPAISIVAVSLNYEQARVVKLWKGDDGKKYTVDDVINIYLGFCHTLDLEQIPNTYYDWACGEMGVIAENKGLSFQKAEKSRELGINLINSLLKNDMLLIFKDKEEEYLKVCDEFETLTTDTNKRKSGVDDLVDAIRYSITKITFSFRNIKINTKKVEPIKRTVGRQTFTEETDEFVDFASEEIDEWNEYYEN
jgi:hypothetical protein